VPTVPHTRGGHLIEADGAVGELLTGDELRAIDVSAENTGTVKGRMGHRQ